MCDRCCRDPNWSKWTQYKPCTAECGGGHRERTRVCLPIGGPSCPNFDNCPDGDPSQTEDCNKQECDGEHFCHQILFSDVDFSESVYTSNNDK